ncbi:MAG TPA: metallophosphoesterase [Planctomycetota bacterium]|nr:metallophosphoesterase [Planctomycetota bacterium]
MFSVLARRWGALPSDRRSWLERRWVWVPAAAYLGVYGLCFLYALLVEAHWVARTETRLEVAQPVLGHDRYRIVHLSDLHLEAVGRREFRVVELVREAKPDLILLTGDYMNLREGASALHEMLVALVAVAPVYGVPGNWDSKFLQSQIFREAGATLLVDDTALLEQGPARLRLVGQEVHPHKPLRELLRGLQDGAFTIFMAHKPDAVDELHDREPGQRVDLFLCGHTHGGQVRLPFWGAVITFSKYHKRFESGRYDFEGVPLYVSRGVGCEGGSAPRVRFLCRPEVAVIDLVAAAGPRGP